MTLRAPLQNLLDKIKPGAAINIIHERKKESGDKGKPDFKVEKNGLLIGYIETKPIGTNLDEILNQNSKSRETEQLYRYLSISPNLILTNYTEFILFKEGKIAKRQLLFHITDKNIDLENISKVSELFDLFFMFTPRLVKKPEQLSELLAIRTKIFKEFVKEVVEDSTNSTFRDKLIGSSGLYQLLKDTLIENLSLDEFCDAYAQTITFGLFLARLNSSEPISKDTAFKYIPKSIGVLRELFKTIEIEDIPESIGWIVDEILGILNNIDKEQFNKLLSFKQTYNYEDPYVYFYEKFLADYDKAKRKAKGVYYTPIPVVLFIIRSINKLLKAEFEVDGLKDPAVTLLDFATGTGTFLLEAFKNAIDETDTGSRKSLIKEHLLKDFYGFECLIAPYTIAHLKLSQFMQDNGYKLNDNERINVYLTDTLDSTTHKQFALFPQISKEGENANQIKLKEPVLVITGNPPYSNHSINNKKWIKELIETYKEGLNEKKINLDDDYIKFLRYGQWKIEQTGKGIMGVITNNSFLEGINHRIMRKKLLETFDKIYVLNLHGNIRKGETDKNVFDVKVGVAISIFVKLPKPLKNKEINYYSITEDGKATSREEKYRFLLENDITTINLKKLEPKAPYYWFVSKEEKYIKEYDEGISLANIFATFGSGISTDRDELFIDFDKNKLTERMKILLSNNYTKEFIEKYNVKDSSSYKLISKIKNKTFKEDYLDIITYRPFDRRWIYYDKSIISRPDFEVMQHFVGNKNIGLVFSRIYDLSGPWNAVIVIENLADKHIIGGESYIAPLYLYNKGQEEKRKQKNLNETEIDRDIYANANFTDDFIAFISNKYKPKPTPEQILGYIYAILHAPTYRKRYEEFLKIEYPKIPFVDDLSNFKKLSELGQRLIDLHILKTDSNSTLGEFKLKGNDYIEKPKYDPKSERLYINSTQYFDNIPEEVWNFEIGGYKVLYKWLSERKTSILSYQDITTFKKIVYVLNETIKIMKDIDKIYVNNF